MDHGDLSGITIHQIRIFLTAAKHENFTKAAEELFMTQASVSRNIQSLELALGLVLFVRHKRRVSLTNAGKSLARDFQQIMKKMDLAVDNAYSQQRNQFQRLVIGDHNCSNEDFYLLPIVREFERRYPDVELIIDRTFPNIVRENLISGEYDGAFSINFALQQLLPPNITTELVFELPPCVVISVLIDLHKTIQKIRDKLPEDQLITFKMLDQAYEQTLRLRSQILSIMYDMIDFGSAKKSDAKALGTGFSQTENKSLIKLVIPEPLPAKKELTKMLENHWVTMIHDAIAQEAKTGIPHFKRAFVMIRITAPRGSRNYQVWDTSNRAINVVINNLKGIFFDDDNFEHLACGIVADWGGPGRTEIRICELEDLKKCEIFR